MKKCPPPNQHKIRLHLPPFDPAAAKSYRSDASGQLRSDEKEVTTAAKQTHRLIKKLQSVAAAGINGQIRRFPADELIFFLLLLCGIPADPPVD